MLRTSALCGLFLVGLAAVVAVLAGSSQSALATGGSGVEGSRSQITLPSRCYNQVVRPTRVILTCADAGFSVQSLRWEGWGTRRAVGMGTAFVNNCEPDCARGTYERFPAMLSASRARSCRGARRQYTLVRYTFTEENPFPADSPFRRRPVVSFGCPRR